MTYADMFSQVKAELVHADVSHISEHLAYQFNIIGEAEGIFYVEVKDGKLYVEKIARGKLDPILAVTLGKLKVEGNIDKALKLKDMLKTRK